MMMDGVGVVDGAFTIKTSTLEEVGVILMSAICTDVPTRTFDKHVITPFDVLRRPPAICVYKFPAFTAAISSNIAVLPLTANVVP